MCPSVLRLCDSLVLCYYQCKFKYSFSMLSVEEKVNVTELLNGLEPDELQSLASTVTKGLLKTNTPNEALEAILQHSDSVESILGRKKVSRELLFNYLHWKKVTTESNYDKKSLANLVMNYWREHQAAPDNWREHQAPPDNWREHQAPPGLCHQPLNPTQGSAVCVVPQDNNQVVSTQLEPGQVDLLALKFSEWFYQLLNKDFLEGGSFALGAEHFWNDATLHIRLNCNNQELLEEAEGDTSVVALLSDVKQRHKLYFSPNLSADGVRGRSEPHGMVSVLVCGTLHQSVGVVVGLFEQIFNLIKDPLTNQSWKIKRGQLMLKSKTNVAAMPTLTEGELTRSLLPIENPD